MKDQAAHQAAHEAAHESLIVWHKTLHKTSLCVDKDLLDLINVSFIRYAAFDAKRAQRGGRERENLQGAGRMGESTAQRAQGDGSPVGRGS